MLDARNFIVRTLLADGVVTEADVRRAQEHAASTKGDVIDSLVQLSIVNGRRLAIAKARLCEYPFVDLQHFEVDFRNTKFLPKQVAERLTCFPLFVVDGIATVAMLDPLNLQAIDQIRQHLRCNVDPVLVDAEQLRTLITRAYTLARPEAGAEQEETQTLSTGDEPIVVAVNQILAAGVESGASDVHLNPEETELVLRYRVDGELLNQQGPPRGVHEAIVQRLKVMAKLDLTQTRKPQDGKFRFRHKADSIDVRLSLVPTVHGENVVMRLLRPAARIGPIAELGMPKDILGWYEAAIEKPHGMILVTGPTGSGKTTTLYTALNRLNTPDVNIMTVEDPVEIRLPMVRQVQVNHELGLNFASALRSFLRQDPDIILVGEIRDQETARIAVQAALTGHLVFSTLHTNDAVGSISRLKDFGLPTFAINSSLLCVLAQRLVRKICNQCVCEEDDHALLADAHALGYQGTFKKGAGCQSCKGMGYRGRMGVFEMMRLTTRLQALVEKNATSAEILRTARAEGMRSLWENGVERAATGVTSLSECTKLRAEFEADDAAGIESAPVGIAA